MKQVYTAALVLTALVGAAGALIFAFLADAQLIVDRPACFVPVHAHG